jgi:hypothetical protein
VLCEFRAFGQNSFSSIWIAKPWYPQCTKKPSMHGEAGRITKDFLEVVFLADSVCSEKFLVF